jgi:LacI family transcriptional regulator
MPNTSVTVSQIAEKAGVSRQTASHILNQKGHLFLPETRVRVELACKELGYRPNAIAKALRSGKFNAVGLVSTLVAHAGNISPYALNGINEAIIKHDLHLVTGHIPAPAPEGSHYLPKLFRELLVDGIILNYTSHVPRSLEEMVAQTRAPFVWMNRKLEFDCVRPDDFQGSRAATEYLLSLGHRDIACVNLVHTEAELRGSPLHYSFVDRLAGYESVMRQAGLQPRLICRHEGVSEEESLAGPFDWIGREDRPTALVMTVAGGGMGRLLLQASSRGVRIPEDLSIVVMANGPFDALGLPMDHVIVPHQKVGRLAVEILLKKVAEPSRSIPCEVVPCELVGNRASVAPPSAR